MIFDKLWSFNFLFQRFYYNGINVQFINFLQVPVVEICFSIQMAQINVKTKLKIKKTLFLIVKV